MEYPFPQADLVDYGLSPEPLVYKTAPPPLDALFLVSIEMSAWITQVEAETEISQIVLH